MASVEYTVVKRKMLINGVKEERYCIKWVPSGKDTTKDIAKKSIMQGTVSDIEFPQFMDLLVKTIREDLKSGHKVRMGMLGVLSPAIACRAVRKVEDCDADIVKRKYVRFDQSTDMKEELKKVTFRKANLDQKSRVVK